MRSVADGHFPLPLTTRPRDYFKAEVDILNEMVAGESNRTANLKRASGEVQHAVAICSESLPENVDHDLRDAVIRVAEKTVVIEAILDEFSWQGRTRPEGQEPAVPDVGSAPPTEPTPDLAL